MKFLFLLLLSTSVFGKTIELNKENTVNLRGPVSQSSVAQVMQDIMKLSKQGHRDEPIYLVLNTPGGSVYAGLDLMNFINTVDRPVIAVANFAASMGFHILQNSPKRYVTEYARIMSHRAAGGFSGEIPQQLNSRITGVIQTIDRMDDHVISRTKGKWNKKSYAELIRDEYWAVGTQAVKDGFADEIVGLKCSQDLLDASEDMTISNGLFESSLKFSRCPLVTFPINEEEVPSQILKHLNEPVMTL